MLFNKNINYQFYYPINKNRPIYTSYNNVYNYWIKLLDKSQYWDLEDIEIFQFNRLKNILNYSYLHIPYYQNLFKKINATPYDIKNINDFSNLPFLTKEIIREQFDEFIPIGMDRKKFSYATTGGSTGIPLGFHKPKYYDAIEKAFIHSLWKRVGYEKSDSIAIFRGKQIPDGKLFYKDKKNNFTYYSSFKINYQNIHVYIDHLNSLKPKYFHIYPSSLWTLCNFIIEKGLKISFAPKAILSSSENISHEQRLVFEKLFNCRVFSWLGLGERTVLAGECENNNELHIFPEHSYVELIRKDKVIKKQGEIGEIIGTNFYNSATPFLRYKTGDLASYSKTNGLCKCNRKHKSFDKIQGRVQEFIYDKNRIKIPIAPAIFSIHESFLGKIELFQFIQDKPGVLILDIVPISNTDSQYIKTSIFNALKDKLDNINFNINIKQSISRIKSGKHKYLIQNLND